MKIKGQVFRLTLAFILMLFSVGCSTSGSVPPPQNSGLRINSMNTAIGGVDGDKDNHEVQRFTYSIALSNDDRDKVFVKEVTLVVPADFEKLLVTKQLTIPVSKEISSRSSINIEGTLDFRTPNMSKDDIMKLNPRINSVKVLSEKTISLDKWSETNSRLP